MAAGDRWRQFRSSLRAEKKQWSELGLLPDAAIASTDEDRLAHAPVASKLCEVVLAAAPPMAVGVFGSWGSGKSGLLRLIAKTVSDQRVPVVCLDAWKYADAPLARQFVTETADQLARQRWWLPTLLRGFAGKRARARVSSRLYETRRRRRISFRGLPALAVGIGLFGLLIALFVLAIASRRVIVNNIPFAEAARGVGVQPLIVAAISGLLAFVFSVFAVDAETTRPGSEEEFEAALRKIMRRAVQRHGRVLFLVDELDRCSPSDVMAALRTIRTFLGVDGSVFVIAGDRAVIEQAAAEAPMHAVARDPGNSYSQSAGSFLDKLFQLQFDLPPVTEGRLTEYAMRLLREAGLFWESLPIEELVPILLPSHVTSPRRVKVLINAFALALGTARASHAARPHEVPSPDGKEEALAKLVVLRTEFPTFAERLTELPELLPVLTEYLVLAERPDETSLADDREELLGNCSRLLREEVEHWANLDYSAEPLLSETSSDDAQESSVRIRRTQELLRYLTRTSDVPHPGRELLFGQSLGQTYGIPPAVATALEMGVFDGRMREVHEVLASATPELRVSTARMLADWTRRYGGLDRRRAMESLLYACRNDLQPPLSLREELSEAYHAYKDRNSVPDEWLIPALGFSTNVSAKDRRGIQLDLLNREKWRESERDVAQVLSLAPFFETDARRLLAELMSSLIKTAPREVLDQCLEMDAHALAEIWLPLVWLAWDDTELEASYLTAVIQRLESALGADAWAHVAHVASKGKSDLALMLAESLGGVTTAVHARDLTRWIADEVIPVESVPAWTTLLHESPMTLEDETLGKTLAVLVTAVEEEKLPAKSAAEFVSACHRAGVHPPKGRVDFESPPQSWWTHEDALRIRRGICAMLNDWTTSWPDVRGFWAYRLRIVEAVLNTGLPLDPELQDWVVDELDAVRARSKGEWLRRVEASGFSSLSPGRQLLARTLVALQLLKVERRLFPNDLLERLMETDDDSARRALALWLNEVKPGTSAVLNMIQRISRFREVNYVAPALGQYVETLTKTTASTFVASLLHQRYGVAPFLEYIRPESVYQNRIAERLAEMLRNSTNPRERKEALVRIESMGLRANEATALLVGAAFEVAERSNLAREDVVRWFPETLQGAPGAAKRLRQLRAHSEGRIRRRVSDLLRRDAD